MGCASEEWEVACVGEVEEVRSELTSGGEG